MSITANDFDIDVHTLDVEECNSGRWKDDKDFERGVTGGDGVQFFESARERGRQEFRALNERMLRGVGRLEAREGR